MMSDLVTDPDAKMDDIEGATNVGAVIKEAPKGSLAIIRPETISPELIYYKA